MRSSLASPVTRPGRAVPRVLAPCLALLVLTACAGTQATKPPREEVPPWETPPVPIAEPSLQQRIAPDLKPIRPVPERAEAPDRGAVPESGLARPLDEDDPSVRILSFVTPKGRPVTLRYRQRARSVGRPNRGHLEDPRCLPDTGPGWVHPGAASCATDETVTLVQFAIGELMQDYPGTVPVVVGALSMPGGGRLRPHKSHRTGRDVDFGFFREGNAQMKHFEDIPVRRIDYEKSFWLMAQLVATGRVQNIYVNYALHAALYEAARNLGYDDEQLSYLFQYPRGRGAKSGVIRHSKGHKRHFHVRFACPLGDDACQEEAAAPPRRPAKRIVKRRR